MARLKGRSGSLGLGLRSALGGLVGLGGGLGPAARLVAAGGGAGLACRGFLGARLFRDVALVAGLEVGLVPAAAAQAEAGSRHLLGQLGLATFRALLRRRIRDLVHDLGLVTAGFADVLVNRHGATAMALGAHFQGPEGTSPDAPATT